MKTSTKRPHSLWAGLYLIYMLKTSHKQLCLSLHFALAVCVCFSISLPSQSSAPSNTVPVMYINTENSEPITSKTTYVKGTYYITTPGGATNSLGTSEEPLSLEIRGRGNSSWRGKKKPYKIRLGAKESLFGMPGNKHWVLINFSDVTIAGMELGRMLGMSWNPHSHPVEVVLNGDYIGLYLLSENVRINKNRVNIYKQADNNDDDTSIPYGWLVEIDNYYESNQIKINENSNWSIRVTYHSPDTLSSRQKTWLTEEFTKINAAIYSTGVTQLGWEKYFDVDAMARFFIVHEVMDNPDGFHGSFFLHKDLCEDSKWIAGPLWDMNCMRRAKTDYTFRMKTSYGFTPHWIGALIKKDTFCEAVNNVWHEFYPQKANEWMHYIESYVMPYEAAYIYNDDRWPSSNYMPLSEKTDSLKKVLTANVEWFDKHLPQAESTSIAVHPASTHFTVYNLQGLFIRNADTYEGALLNLPKGIYIINGKKLLVK